MSSMLSTGTSLQPPFSVDVNVLFNSTAAASQPTSSPTVPLKSLPHTARLSLPAAYRDYNNNLQEVDEGDPDKLKQYLERELDVSRLNKIHRHLWLAGRPMCARPLHRQVLLDRQIIVAEQADLHMVWQESRVFLKPLPDFLLDYEFWRQNLCQSQPAHESASGLLLSYVWLICNPSDLHIAHDKGLLSSSITWERWTIFVRSFLHRSQYDSLVGINRRYHYGELRLSRLNWIYRLSSGSRSMTKFIRGYMYGYNRYSVFVQRNFGWLLVTFVYITIVLTAMQVGLATDLLSQNGRFQDASYAFTVFSILTPLIGIVLILVVLLGSLVLNLLDTLAFKEKVEHERQVLIKQRMAKVP